MYQRNFRRSRFGESLQDKLNRLRSSSRPGVNSAFRHSYADAPTSPVRSQPTSQPAKINSNIIKDIGGGKVSILGKTYDKNLVSEKMKEVDNIMKTMTLPEIKKKFGL